MIKSCISRPDKIFLLIVLKKRRFIKAAPIAQIPEGFFAAIGRQSHQADSAADQKIHPRSVVREFIALLPLARPACNDITPAFVMLDQFCKRHGIPLI